MALDVAGALKLVKHPVVKRPVVLELERAKRVRDALTTEKQLVQQDVSAGRVLMRMSRSKRLVDTAARERRVTMCTVATAREREHMRGLAL